jgi:STE24 endopeptidase
MSEQMDNYPAPDPERQKIALKYENISRKLLLLELTLTAIILLAILFSGIFVRLNTVLDSPRPWIISVYLVLLLIIPAIISAPISYYSEFVLGRRFGLSTQSFRSWAVDKMKSGLLTLVLGLIMIIFIYWMLEIDPQLWWLWSGCFLVLLVIVIARLTPTLLIPIFYKLEPLKDAGLEDRLRRLCDRAGTTVMGIFTMNLSSKSTTANAMLAGIGNTRRIILTDTLLQTYTGGEIEVILAHELGHHLHRDIVKLIVLQSLVIFLGLFIVHLVLTGAAGFFGYQSPDNPASLPLMVIVLAVYNAIVTPVINAYSRSIESAADAAAIELTANPAEFISAMTRLVDQNLSVASPRRWVELLFYSHPPYNKRIKPAIAVMEKNSGGNR